VSQAKGTPTHHLFPLVTTPAISSPGSGCSKFTKRHCGFSLLVGRLLAFSHFVLASYFFLIESVAMMVSRQENKGERTKKRYRLSEASYSKQLLSQAERPCSWWFCKPDTHAQINNTLFRRSAPKSRCNLEKSASEDCKCSTGSRNEW